MSEKVDLNTTIGVYLICVTISAALFGVVGVQTFHYFQNYGSDNVFVKLTVSTLLVMELLHSVCNIHALYHYTIINYTNPTVLSSSTWSLTATLAISCVVVSIVHVFYIRRVYYMSQKNVILVSLIMVLASGRFVMNIIITVKAFQSLAFSSLVPLTPYISTSLSLSAATDITIAASLSFYLYKSRSGIRNTNTMINRLMVYTINNGILTSMFDIIVIVFAVAQPRNLIFVSIYQIVGNLYTNSMLAMLNSRRSLAQAGELAGISFRIPVSMTSTGRPVTTGTKPDNLTQHGDVVEA